MGGGERALQNKCKYQEGEKERGRRKGKVTNRETYGEVGRRGEKGFKDKLLQASIIPTLQDTCRQYHTMVKSRVWKSTALT